MKLIIKSTDASHLYVLKELLEANGIPAFVKGENTARIVTLFIMTEPSLWIYLDEQYEDAQSLVGNPEYKVKNPVDMDVFNEVVKSTTEKPEKLNNALIHSAFTMGLILLGMLVLIKILQWLAT